MRGCYNGDWVSEWAAQWRRKYGLILFFFFPNFLPFYVFVSSSQTPTRTIKTKRNKTNQHFKTTICRSEKSVQPHSSLSITSVQAILQNSHKLSYFLWFHCSRLDWIQIQFLWSQYNNNNNNTQHKKKKKRRQKTKQPLERPKTKRNTYDSCCLIFSIVLFYIEYRNGKS